MSETLDEDRSAAERALMLRDLLASPGWQLLVAQVSTEWGDAGYGQQVRIATLAVPSGPERAYQIADVLDRIEHTKAAVDQIMSWPQKEVTRLAPEKKHSPMFAMRRGPK